LTLVFAGCGQSAVPLASNRVTDVTVGYGLAALADSQAACVKRPGSAFEGLVNYGRDGARCRGWPELVHFARWTTAAVQLSLITVHDGTPLTGRRTRQPDEEPLSKPGPRSTISRNQGGVDSELQFVLSARRRLFSISGQPIEKPGRVGGTAV